MSASEFPDGNIMFVRVKRVYPRASFFCTYFHKSPLSYFSRIFSRKSRKKLCRALIIANYIYASDDGTRITSNDARSGMAVKPFRKRSGREVPCIVFLSPVFSCPDEFQVRSKERRRNKKKKEEKKRKEKKREEKEKKYREKSEGGERRGKARVEHEQDREKEALSHRRVVWVGHGSFSTSE